MTSFSWERLAELLEKAMALPPDERAAFVDEQTAGSPELRAELRSLLAASRGADDYMSRLRFEILGNDLSGALGDPASLEGAPDPWIGRIVSHYEILDRIGGGGMGVVYRARDATLDREVALKFIAPELRLDSGARRRLLQEARAASKLDHPNICTVHEIGESDDGRMFIVMPAYDGETLRERIDRGPIPEREALALATQLARALSAAHARGIVHRDVKPDNALLVNDGVLKLLDFGLALTTEQWMSGAVDTGGTVAYMSPERARGERADERSDVWGLGVILFEMLAGVRPFPGNDPEGIIHQTVTVEPDLEAVCPEVRPETVQLVRRALSRDPDARFANGGEVLTSLLAVGSRADEQAGGPRLWQMAAAAVVLGLVGLGIGLGARTSGPDAVGDLPDSAPHVLWVDDDPANNRFIIEQFNRQGVRVSTALSTAEGLARYDPATFQLVISDMGRYEGPDGAYVGRAGLELLDGLRSQHDAVQIAFCTSARAVAEYREESLAAGARDIVTDCEVILRYLGIEPRSPARP